MHYKLLSYIIDENTPLYGNTPVPKILHHNRISSGNHTNSVILSIHNHTGTHIDASKHFIDSGKKISDYSTDQLIFVNPIIVNCPTGKGSLITPQDLHSKEHELQIADFLIFLTGFGRFRNEQIYKTHNPGISPETILWIREYFPNIRCIGIDSISISSYQHREIGREAHNAAFFEGEKMGAPLLLVEDMKLDEVSNKIIKKIFILPWLIKDIDSAPCSILAEVI